MKKIVVLTVLIITGLSLNSCSENEKVEKEEKMTMQKPDMGMAVKDERISLKLNPMQKNHQLVNMRSHLEAIQTLIGLISQEKYDEASKVAYEKLGSTTEMQLMCSSFGNKKFEDMGLAFHKSADKMSEILKTKDKDKSLEAISNTMNYCVQCHSLFRQ